MIQWLPGLPRVLPKVLPNENPTSTPAQLRVPALTSRHDRKAAMNCLIPLSQSIHFLE